MAALSTALGWIAVAWSDSALLRLSLGHDSEAAALQALFAADSDLAARHRLASAAAIPWKLRDRLRAYAAGRPEDFADVPVELSHVTDFQRAVLHKCRGIRYGQARSYGELARAAGKPNAARAVGTVMSSNRVPLIIPCHRVLGAGGKLGGYSGPRGIGLKMDLLRLEGQR